VEHYLESIPLDAYVTGAAQPKLNQQALNSIPIPIPEDLEIQQRLVDGIDAMNEEAQRLESIYQRKLAVLDELKQSLLHEAFSGKL
jgi:type I restriction enzyme S subunit